MSETLSQFVTLLNRIGAGRYSYRVEIGRANARIVMAPILQGVPSVSNQSVYCFVRLADGAILKAASWRAPAKGVRAWLDQVLADPSPVGMTTGWLYRRG